MDKLFSKISAIIPDVNKFLPGASSANEITGFDITKLCNQSEANVKDTLLYLASIRNVVRITRIILINESNYPLVYVNSGSSSGYFFSDASFAFQQKNTNISNILEKSWVGGILHSQLAYQDLFGSCGCIIFLIPTETKNYLVKFGFYNSSLNNRAAGIEITEE
jgi:hypothetical protein